jgi:dTDP-4-amino-4,6-dideoxygalactose transaminase
VNVRFVEDKRLDWEMVGELLAVSECQNQWANFGPVSLLLERTIERLLQVPADRAAVATSSGTAAMFALAGIAAARLGRPLRWLGSAFGHFSTRIGPLAGTTRFVDCDARGFLDLTEVDQIDCDSWDGLLVTSVFGADVDIAKYATYCRERGKALIVDNAMCLLGFDRSCPLAPAEFISFHHTKPWGFGEGGCAILARDDVPLFRQLINFGHQASPALAPFAANGKISDIGAAAIVSRLNQLDNWATAYADQRRRICAIATKAGLEVFLDPLNGGVIGFVPLLAPRWLCAAAVRSSDLPLARYYPPLSEKAVARDLFERNICVPCHPGMLALEDGVIEAGLRRVVTANGRTP